MRILLNVEQGFINPILYEKENEEFSRNGGNVGNKVFTQAIYNMLNIPENTIEFVELNDMLQIVNYTYEEINEKFDLFVFATVIFGTSYVMRRNIQTYTKIVQNLRIPVFCFSVGTQIESYDLMDELIEGTKDVASEFITSVINKNGGMALRGFFTKEYFERLGYNQFEVTGCPSMYQNGRGFRLENKIVLPNEFGVAFNGNTSFLRTSFVKENMKKYIDSNYLDQDQFVSLIYGNDIEVIDIKKLRLLISEYSFRGLELFAEHRIKLICNFSEWKDYFRENNISFSFGSRIHGNIIAILSNISAMVCYCDSRTREMAEFFEIPNIDIKEIKKKDVYELYCDADFSKFNMGYEDKLSKLDDMLYEYGIPHDMDYNKGVAKKEVVQHYNDFENEKNIQIIKSVLSRFGVCGKLIGEVDRIRNCV